MRSDEIGTLLRVMPVPGVDRGYPPRALPILHPPGSAGVPPAPPSRPRPCQLRGPIRARRPHSREGAKKDVDNWDEPAINPIHADPDQRVLPSAASSRAGRRMIPSAKAFSRERPYSPFGASPASASQRVKGGGINHAARCDVIAIQPCVNEELPLLNSATNTRLKRCLVLDWLAKDWT